MAHLNSARSELVWFLHRQNVLKGMIFAFFIVLPFGLLHNVPCSTAVWWKPVNRMTATKWNLDFETKIKTIFWSLNCGVTNFLCITTKWSDSIMLFCFMFVSSRETPACLAAPEVCTKCPTGAPHQAQGTSARSRLFAMTTQMLAKAALSKRERNLNKIPFSPLLLSVSLFICNEMFRPPDPSGGFWDWTQAVRRIQCTSSFRLYDSNGTQSDSCVEIKPSLLATVAFKSPLLPL